MKKIIAICISDDLEWRLNRCTKNTLPNRSALIESLLHKWLDKKGVDKRPKKQFKDNY